jgi:hypothetical protein
MSYSPKVPRFLKYGLTMLPQMLYDVNEPINLGFAHHYNNALMDPTWNDIHRRQFKI